MIFTVKLGGEKKKIGGRKTHLTVTTRHLAG